MVPFSAAIHVLLHLEYWSIKLVRNIQLYNGFGNAANLNVRLSKIQLIYILSQ